MAIDITTEEALIADTPEKAMEETVLALKNTGGKRLTYRDSHGASAQTQERSY